MRFGAPGFPDAIISYPITDMITEDLFREDICSSVSLEGERYYHGQARGGDWLISHHSSEYGWCFDSQEAMKEFIDTFPE